MARAIAKPVMPTSGPIMLPWLAASTSRVPMMGPVQEKETMTRVDAMKKMLNKPVVFSALLSILLLQESGSLISNAPKKEMANTTSNKKKMILTTALVAMALSALAPKMAVNKIPNRRKMTIMEMP